MSRSKVLLTALVSAFLYSMSPIFTDLSASNDEQSEQVTAAPSCRVPVEFYDQEAMAKTAADPAKFMELMALFADPQTAQNVMQCSMNAEMWNNWMANMMDPASDVH